MAQNKTGGWAGYVQYRKDMQITLPTVQKDDTMEHLPPGKTHTFSPAGDGYLLI